MRAAVSLLVLVAACGDGCKTTERIPERLDAYTFEDGPPCTTRITYASTWIRPASHSADFDDADGFVSWDGSCTDDGPNSYATLSNGWKPYFTGHQACAIAIDTQGACGYGKRCDTRITYAATWIRPASSVGQYDDVIGRVFSDGTCTNTGSESYATLSNGWQPHFTGTDACGMSFRWLDCGGLYQNPVIPMNCPDPGVAYDGTTFVLTCTSGNAANAFPLFTSPDLVHWTAAGHIFSSTSKPAWAVSDFWAPELHHIASTWIAYFTARGSDGKLAIGAASAPDILGPYTALATPLVHSNTVGLIDATELSSGSQDYLVWKEDGNAQNQPTPIRGSALASDGLSLVGTTTQLITNDQTWEGNLVEGPWVVNRADLDGQQGFYLFYSGNAYYDGRYAIGVAKATSPLGPYTKFSGNPILKTTAEWVGPGHGSVIPGPPDDAGQSELYLVYHAWQAGHVNGPGDGRMVLVDQVQWGTDGWPHIYGAPSIASRPMP